MEALDKYFSRGDNPLVSTALRYNGFWNDIGEACKAFLPKGIYYGTYAATGTYAAACVWYTGRREFTTTSPTIKQVLQSKAAQDAMIWHSFATVSLTPLLIAGIKQVCKRAGLGMNACAAIGVVAIPVLVPPIDNLVTAVMNKYYRDQPQPMHWSGLWAWKK